MQNRKGSEDVWPAREVCEFAGAYRGNSFFTCQKLFVEVRFSIENMSVRWIADRPELHTVTFKFVDETVKHMHTLHGVISLSDRQAIPRIRACFGLRN